MTLIRSWRRVVTLRLGWQSSAPEFRGEACGSYGRTSEERPDLVVGRWANVLDDPEPVGVGQQVGPDFTLDLVGARHAAPDRVAQVAGEGSPDPERDDLMVGSFATIAFSSSIISTVRR